MPKVTLDHCLKALINTGLFSRPEGDLRSLFDLSTTGSECYVFASYAGKDSAYYLNDGDNLLRPTGDENAFTFPWYPVSIVKAFDLETYLREPNLALPIPMGYTPLDFYRKNKEKLESLVKGTKYIKVINVHRLAAGHYADSTIRRSVRESFKSINGLVEESFRAGVSPSDVLVVTADLQSDENFYAYLAGVALRRLNYLVTERSLGVGSLADLFAYRAKGFERGSFLLELSMGLRDIGSKGENEESAALVEAEPEERVHDRTKHGIGQALRYLRESTGHYDRAFVSGPLAVDLIGQEKDVGVITFDDEGEIRFQDAPKAAPSPREHELVMQEARNLVSLANARSSISYDGEFHLKVC
ncbi:MAG: hypothetical protein JRM98_04675 [Nitrososphaerota archaeon]|nr:hypothetical protein [Nitrososphaerota archaeon]